MWWRRSRRDAAGTVEALVAKKGNRFALDLAPDLGEMRTDAVKLRQCLFNLLGNAAKFTEGGTVTLRVRRERRQGSDRLTFEVIDTGIGMTPDQVASLFERFKQADETTTRRFGGTGLGLALTKALARLMGGDVTVTSAEGVGTTFTLALPAILPDPQQESTLLSPSLTDAEPHGDGRVVLIIDDEASQRDLMVRYLTRQGFAARAVADGRSGIDLARKIRPMAILLDVMMPEMDGWAVLATLKADAITQDIPVVMVSFVADAALGASLGAAGSIPKPVDWPRLRGVLDRIGTDAGDVLVVDDDAEMRRRVRLTLVRHGFAVREAGDGAEALRAGPRGTTGARAPRPDDAGDGRVHLPARTPRHAGLCGGPGGGAQRQGRIRGGTSPALGRRERPTQGGRQPPGRGRRPSNACIPLRSNRVCRPLGGPPLARRIGRPGHTCRSTERVPLWASDAPDPLETSCNRPTGVG